MMRRVLVARLDSLGDVLLAGPAIRAVADRAEVVLLCGPRGDAAAHLLPGVAEVIVWDAPWISNPPPEVDIGSVARLIEAVRRADAAEAVVLTSFHQSPLPLGLLLRLAGVAHITGASVDYAGSLLDVRLRPGIDFPEDQPESERALAIAAAAGYPSPDDRGLRVHRSEPPDAIDGLEGFVVLHPGAAVPSRRWTVDGFARAARMLQEFGRTVVLTGSDGERELTRPVVTEAPGLIDLVGGCSLAELAEVLRAADAVVCGNTGPAHLAAAVGTPVVSLFSPVVPAERWAPHGVPRRILGDQDAPCRGSRARECPVPGHPCLASVRPEQVVRAVFDLDCERTGTARVSTAEATMMTEVTEAASGDGGPNAGRSATGGAS